MSESSTLEAEWSPRKSSPKRSVSGFLQLKKDNDTSLGDLIGVLEETPLKLQQTDRVPSCLSVT